MARVAFGLNWVVVKCLPIAGLDVSLMLGERDFVVAIIDFRAREVHEDGQGSQFLPSGVLSF